MGKAVGVREVRAVLFVVIVACLLGALVACSPDAECTGDEVEVRFNTQVTYGDLKVGAGNRDGDTATLWIFYRGRSDLDRTVEVRAGDWLEVGTYRICVVRVTRESVRLQIGDGDR